MFENLNTISMFQFLKNDLVNLKFNYVYENYVIEYLRTCFSKTYK